MLLVKLCNGAAVWLDAARLYRTRRAGSCSCAGSLCGHVCGMDCIMLVAYIR